MTAGKEILAKRHEETRKELKSGAELQFQLFRPCLGRGRSGRGDVQGGGAGMLGPPARSMAAFGSGRVDLAERALARAAPVPAGSDRATLAVVHLSALYATPGILAQGLDRVIERVTDGDPEAIAVHVDHLAIEVRPMIGPALQDVVLPLVNHLVRERFDDFLCRLTRKQMGGQLDHAPREPPVGMSRADPAHEHPGGRGEPVTPLNVDHAQGAAEIAVVQLAPQLLNAVAGEFEWRGDHAGHYCVNLSGAMALRRDGPRYILLRFHSREGEGAAVA